MTSHFVILSEAKDPFRNLMHNHKYFVYLLASPTGTLYIGVTDDLMRRVAEHKAGNVPGFTKKYHCTKLVYFEEFVDVSDAITREEELKGWLRKKKETLICTINPG
jgi:putative endonuclease